MGTRDTACNPAWDAPQQRMAPPVDDRSPLGPVQLFKSGEREPRQGAFAQGKKEKTKKLHIFTWHAFCLLCHGVTHVIDVLSQTGVSLDLIVLCATVFFDRAHGPHASPRRVSSRCGCQGNQRLLQFAQSEHKSALCLSTVKLNEFFTLDPRPPFFPQRALPMLEVTWKKECRGTGRSCKRE